MSKVEDTPWDKAVDSTKSKDLGRCEKKLLHYINVAKL